MRNINFKRITSSNNFIPEIDGLRFIAILSVVLLHIRTYLIKHDETVYTDSIDYSKLSDYLLNGSFGVHLFFVISGFILGFPFAKQYLINGKKVKLKDYFFRRLTRLEPPYIIAMTLLFVFYVFVVGSIPFLEGIKSYFASIFYVHNFIYPDARPYLNGVAWSLEVEVQFYILAPILTLIFLIKRGNVRRIITLLLISISLLINYLFDFGFVSLLNFIHYFLIGFLLVDLYVSKTILIKKSKFDSIIALTLLILIFSFSTSEFLTSTSKFIFELIRLLIVFIFYYYVIFLKSLKFLSNKTITNIGGMCYSIYLLHVPIMQVAGKFLTDFKFSNFSFINVTLYVLILLFTILVVSACFFLLIERPCMDKNWIKKLVARFK